MIITYIPYFGNISFWTEVLSHDGDWKLEKHEHYQKRTLRNRTHIVDSQGLQQLSIPLQKGKNGQTLISDVQIAEVESWRKKHWSGIKTAYGKSPFFPYYENQIKDAIFYESKTLWDFNLNTINVVLDILGVSKKPLFSNEYQKTFSVETKDLRNHDFLESIPHPTYGQLFEDRLGKVKNPSILDVIFCLGPSAPAVLKM